MTGLNVNIDHIATLRRAREGIEPNPVRAALAAEKAGAGGIVAHLREDRRHIVDKDIHDLKKSVTTKLNMEMGATEEMTKIALSALPDMATLVPEKRKELTTEGGLEVAQNLFRIRRIVSTLSEAGITTSLFIDPSSKQIEAAADTGTDMVEIHTGSFANAHVRTDREKELEMIANSVSRALNLGLRVSAGHGLDYENTREIASIKGIEELNIGYGIITRAVFCGMERAVKEMLKIILEAGGEK